MPIKPPPPVRLYGDLERGHQIARSWGLLDRLARADAELVISAIAQGIAEGRRHGLDLAQMRPEWSRAERSRERSLTGD
jgi:hypothetical protein